MRVSGLVPPVITPLTAGGLVDVGAIERITARLLDAGIDGMFVLGSSGEGPSLSDEQRRATTIAYREASAGRVPIYMGAPDPSPERAAATVRMAVELEVDAVVLGAPYYFTGAGSRHVRDHVLRGLGDADLPAIIYNLPQAMGNAFTPDVVRELAIDTRIVAIKDSCADGPLSVLLQSAADEARIDFLQGAEALMLASIVRGASGIIPGAANIVPHLCRALLDAARAGEIERAETLQADLVAACDVIYRGGHWLSALKATASEIGLCGPATSGGLPPVDRTAVFAELSRVSAVDAA